MVAFLSLLLLADIDGAALYQSKCAGCHDAETSGRVPARAKIAALTPEAIVASLTSGSMAAQGKALSVDERNALATYLTGKAPAARPAVAARRCADPAKPLSLAGWNGWANDVGGSRFQPEPGLRAEDVPKLQLKWAFVFDFATQAYAQPAVLGGRVLVGSASGRVYALDLSSGCEYWQYRAPSGVRTAISVGPAGEGKFAAYFGDLNASVHAVDADSGALLWKTKVDEHRFARITGAPTLYQDRIYVPVSSIEELAAGNTGYSCCSFRGSIVALDTATGKQIWKTSTIAEPLKEFGKGKSGQPMLGPAGAAVWSAPSIDRKRKLLYVGTGNAYNAADTATSDSILALDLDTGAVRWAKQVLGKDGFNMSCMSPKRENCEAEPGPDYDFGPTPILRDLGDGHSLVVAAQKSGAVYGLNPDKNGEVVWQAQAGQGGPLGGVEWGHAADAKAVYVPVSDIQTPAKAKPGGLYAFRLTDGTRLWSVLPTPECPPEGASSCHGAQSAAISVIPGVIFSGSYDGKLRAYSVNDGRVIWSFQTARSYDGVNGIAGRGGSIDAAGPVIASGVVLTNSGYGNWGGMAGNVLLAFSVDGK
jgi:polyvinyl alcohol dehydrogenase (cytochrome)